MSTRSSSAWIDSKFTNQFFFGSSLVRTQVHEPPFLLGFQCSCIFGKEDFGLAFVLSIKAYCNGGWRLGRRWMSISPLSMCSTGSIASLLDERAWSLLQMFKQKNMICPMTRSHITATTTNRKPTPGSKILTDEKSRHERWSTAVSRFSLLHPLLSDISRLFRFKPLPSSQHVNKVNLTPRPPKSG